MIRIFKLVLLLVVSQVALGQAPSNYTNINGRYRWIAGMFDSTFHIPKGTTPSLRTGGSTNGGALFYKTADSSLQLYTGTQWLRMLKVGDTTGMLTPYFNSVGVGLKNTGQTVYADTLLLSTRLWRNKGIDSVQANLTAGLATKLNISDTASMLSPYARTVNVRQIVSDSLGGLVRLKALNAGGAALYANSGTKVAEWGLGGSANMDFHGFAGYDINRASSYTVRSFTDKNYVDSAISASPSGTVTSVATNTGTGITGGTITTSGTLAIDTLLISTRAWRQKGIDSVQANLTAGLALKVNISDTASMLSPYLRNNTAAATYVPQTRTITINGTSQDLTANRTYNVGTVTSVGATAGTGISVSGSPITSSGSFTITNTAPDQTVAISAGTGISVSGTYPNFTVTNTSPSSGGTVTSVGTNNGTGITGGTITGAGTLAIDTLLIATRAWRKKGDDSVAALLSGYVPTSRTITINGTTQDLTADRTWNVGTVTTAAATGGGQVAFFNSSTVLTSISTLYFDGVNKLAIGNSSPDSMLSVTQGAHIQRGVRLSGLPTASGTKSLRIDANGSLSVSDTLTNGISGSGTTNYIPKFTSSSAIGNSQLFDNGTNVGIGTSSPAAKLDVTTGIRVNSSGIITSGFADGVNLGTWDALGYNSAGNTIVLGGYRSSQWSALGLYTSGTLKATLDASGNLGLGVTPSAWSTGKAFELNALGNSLWGIGNGDIILGSNFYYNADFKYAAANYATGYRQQDGVHKWLISSSGTANATISFTQAMTLDASGRLAIGLTSPVARLHIENSASADPTSLSSVPTTNIFGMSTSPGGMLAAGIGATGGTYVWLQGRNVAGAGVSYPISLQPLGGNVGIGTTSPAALTEINPGAITNGGAAKFALAIRSGGTTYLDIYQGFNSTIAGQSILGSTLVSSDALAFATNNTERMRITSGGNVGIGTTSPDANSKLDVNGQAFVARLALYNDNGTPSLGTSPLLYSPASGTLAISTASAERMRITSGGNVGINTTTPNSILDIAGSVAAVYASKTATYTLTGSDYTVRFDAVTANANLTANLPDATTCKGRIYVIMAKLSSTTNVTLDGNGAQTIGGSATWGLWDGCNTDATIVIQSDGSNWNIISYFGYNSTC